MMLPNVVLWLMESRRFFEEQMNILFLMASIIAKILKPSGQGIQWNDCINWWIYTTILYYGFFLFAFLLLNNNSHVYEYRTGKSKIQKRVIIIIIVRKEESIPEGKQEQETAKLLLFLLQLGKIKINN